MLVSTPGYTRRPVLLWLLTAFLVSAGAWLVVDIGKFAWWARAYATRASMGPGQIPVPVTNEEAIVVLTGDHGRIPKALELLRLRGSPMLVISGIRHGITLTELVNQQGDSTINIHEIWKKIVVEAASSSTIENAQETAKILQRSSMKRVVLVTSEYHMFRAAAIFRAGAPGYDYMEYPLAAEVAEISLWPTSRTVTAVWKLWIEYWKFFLYRWTGTHPIIPHPKQIN